uniref:Uncharacterized protein n=1 Tax=Moniliophthora roreri TaxID=221103 RepID=A0A0W0GAI7_MONRR
MSDPSVEPRSWYPVIHFPSQRHALDLFRKMGIPPSRPDISRLRPQIRKVMEIFMFLSCTINFSRDWTCREKLDKGCTPGFRLANAPLKWRLKRVSPFLFPHFGRLEYPLKVNQPSRAHEDDISTLSRMLRMRETKLEEAQAPMRRSLEIFAFFTCIISVNSNNLDDPDQPDFLFARYGHYRRLPDRRGRFSHSTREEGTWDQFCDECSSCGLFSATIPIYTFSGRLHQLQKRRISNEGVR